MLFQFCLRSLFSDCNHISSFDNHWTIIATIVQSFIIVTSYRPRQSLILEKKLSDRHGSDQKKNSNKKQNKQTKQ